MTDFEESLRHASIRIRRLYACACYAFVKDRAKSKVCDQAVAFAIENVDDLTTDEGRLRFSEHRKTVRDAVGHAADEGQLCEIVREVALQIVQESPAHGRLVTATWSLRAFINQTFDEGIIECLLSEQRNSILKSMPSHCIGLAQEIYEGGNDLIPVLADALEDLGNVTELEHLRSCKQHHKGCWVIDNILGRN